MRPQADVHEDRDSAWLLGLADAVAAELVTTREAALTIMASVFQGASDDDGPFTLGTVAELARAGRLCERLAAPPAVVEMERAGGAMLFDAGTGR